MIPIILNKNHSLQDLVTRNTGGIGELPEAFSADAVEEANGLKEASFKIPTSALHYKDISKGSYIKIKDDEYHDPQIYEVYRITKPMNGIVTVRMQHISYILGKATVLPFTSTGVATTISNMQSHLVGTFPFTMDTDIANSSSVFKLDIPRSFRGTIAGWRGSLLDVFGGELDWDNLNVHLLRSRGRDNGVRIEYGKNLVDIEQEESIAEVYDAVLGYAVVDDVTTCGTVQKITTTNSPRTLNVDFSNQFGANNPPTVTQLNTLAMQYAVANGVGRPHINLNIKFAPLWKTDEYKDVSQLERVGLFDTVHVYFEKLGVDAEAKVITTHYDFINEKPISIELGDAKPNLNKMLGEQVGMVAEEQRKEVNAVESAMNDLSSAILNSLGLFVTKVEKSGGGYQYYLHNKPNLNESQYQWTINAGGFAVSQDYGASWRTGIDSDGNAVFNSIAANRINAMTITGSEISGGLITGTEIDSGDMYWFKGTANEARMYAARWTWEGANCKGVYLGSGAWWCNAGNAHHIMYNNFIQLRVGNDIGHNTVTIRDDSISLMRSVSGANLYLGTSNASMSYGSQKAYIGASSSGVTIGTTNYSGGFTQRTVRWRTLTIDGQSITFLVQGSS